MRLQRPRRRTRRAAAALTVVGLLVLPACASDTPSVEPRGYTRDASWADDETTPACDKVKKAKKKGHNSTRRSVRDIQELVGAEVDGSYGLETTTKVKAWQKCNGLKADGNWGKESDTLAFADADAAAAAEKEREREREREARRWHCRDFTSFDQNAFNDNLCENEYERRFVSDHQAMKLDPDYDPGRSGHEWYNDQ